MRYSIGRQLDTAGTGFDRDASFFDREIAKFYEALFFYDWGRIGPAKIDESLPGPILVALGNEVVALPGYIAVPLSTILGRSKFYDLVKSNVTKLPSEPATKGARIAAIAFN